METGEVIEREMTADEIAASLQRKAHWETEQQILAEKAIARAALLEKLGITEDEAKLLLS